MDVLEGVGRDVFLTPLLIMVVGMRPTMTVGTDLACAGTAHIIAA